MSRRQGADQQMPMSFPASASSQPERPNPPAPNAVTRLPFTYTPLPVYTIADRVALLRSLLQDESFATDHANIQLIIDMYVAGRLKDGDTVWARDGRIYYNAPEPLIGHPMWFEEVGKVLSQFMNPVVPMGLPAASVVPPADQPAAMDPPAYRRAGEVVHGAYSVVRTRYTSKSTTPSLAGLDSRSAR